MIEIKEKDQCCGCEACKNICPKQCITMVEDEEGFRYPHIDKEKCINCGLCERVCPILHESSNTNLKKETEFFAAFNNEEDTIKNSSSGGVFSLLAENILSKNGVVYGVIQEDVYKVKFIRAENKEKLNKIRGSKYLQANIEDMYIEAKKDLEEGKKVLFSGTPCQIAGLYNVLGKENDNLLTVDVVCHGVPSDAVYREYINYVEEKNKKQVINIKWRDKIQGWGPNRITLYFNDGTTETKTSSQNPFQTGFLKNIYLRPSCYKCKYAKLPRIGDISLADFWGYNGKLLEKNKNRGLSILIISSKKGKRIFDEISKNMTLEKVSEDYVKSKSRHVYLHPEENEKRAKFFKDFKKMKFKTIKIKYGMEDLFFIKLLKKIKRKIVK